MIKRVLLSTLALLLVYSWFISQYGAGISRTGQTTEQRNMVKAEEFLFEASTRYDTIIVGSSMSDRLNTDSLSAAYYNLSLAGMSAQDGLQLIEMSGHLPHVLFVETNTLTRDEPSPLMESLNDPTWIWLKRHLPFTRQKFQPAGVFKAMLRDWSHGKGQPVVPETAMYVDTAFLNKAVADRIQAAIPPPDSVLHASLGKVRNRLDQWRRQGVRVVFFEIPMDPRLQAMPIQGQVRQLVRRYFPSPDYAHLALPEGAYQTTDGVHLTYGESNRFTGYLRQQIQGYIGGPYLVKKE
ncbi:hypothetical protein [Rudanella lutea]|uniref:hypothetical protein n=1 Tax=Rudanella lutea TaxID=451374 RepID=UPI00039EA4DB|nr:hypothetical protein [Rudanella lutea]